MDPIQLVNEKTNAVKSFFQNFVDQGSNVANTFGSALKQGLDKISSDIQATDVSGPSNEYNFQDNSLKGKLTTIMEQSGLDPNSPEMQMLSDYTINGLQNNLPDVKSGLIQNTGYQNASEQYASATSDYFKTISELPGYAQIRKKYMDEVSTSDLDFAINQLSKNRDSAYSMIMAEAYKRGDVINPYNIQQQASNLKTMYNSQINTLIENKNNRLEEAKDQAKIDYEDMMNRVKLGSDMLDRLKGMKEDAYDQVKDGVTDFKRLTELDNTIKRTERDFNLRLAEVKQKTGIENANLLFKMTEYQNKYGQEEDITQKQQYFNQYINNQVSILDGVMKGTENADKVVTTLQSNSLGYNIYENEGGIVAVGDYSMTNELLGKQGGSVSWRTNNPGNITYSSPDTAKRLGAVGIYKNYNNLKGNGDPWTYLVFSSPEAGAQAMSKLLMTGKSYLGKTVGERLKTWQGGSSSAISVLSRTNPELLNKKDGFTQTEMQQITQAITQSESWQVGNALDINIKKDYFVEQKNMLSISAQQLRDKGYSRQETNQLLKQQYGEDYYGTIAEVLGQVYTNPNANTTDFNTLAQKMMTPGSYTTSGGLPKTDELINDIMKTGEFQDMSSGDVLSQAWSKIIRENVKNNVDKGEQIIMKALTTMPTKNDFFVDDLIQSGMTKENIQTLYKGIFEDLVGTITDTEEDKSSIENAGQLIKTLRDKQIGTENDRKERLKSYYEDGSWLRGFEQEIGQAIYNSAFK